MRVPADEVGALVASLLGRAGATPEDGARVADALVEASLSGRDGHGVARLPGYVARLRDGGSRSGPWRLARADGPFERYDGRAGLGHVHLADAVTRAVALAGVHGVGLVGVSDSNHAGALGLPAARIAEAGHVGVVCTNAPAVLAPPGGRAPVLGTNPIAVAAPVPGARPVVCDLSSSVVTRGRVMLAHDRGERLEPGWAHARDGSPTTDPAEALRGTLAPLGGGKGFALALAVEILTGVLVGPSVGPEVADFFEQPAERPQGVAHLAVALDPARLSDGGHGDRMLRLAAAIRASGEEGEVRLPGARGAARIEAAGGRVELDGAVASMLARLAAELGVPAPPWLAAAREVPAPPAAGAGAGAGADRVVGLDHVQVAAPPGSEAAARRFYGALLGLPELPKPHGLAARGGVWFACGGHALHVGVEREFRPARQAHPALRVASAAALRALAARLAADGAEPLWDDALPGVDRFYVADPFGNRLELLADA